MAVRLLVLYLFIYLFFYVIIIFFFFFFFLLFLIFWSVLYIGGMVSTKTPVHTFPVCITQSLL